MNVTEVKSNVFLFLKLVINKAGELPVDPIINPEAKQKHLKNNSTTEEVFTESESVEVPESSALTISSSINYAYYNYGYRGGWYTRSPESNSIIYDIVTLRVV